MVVKSKIRQDLEGQLRIESRQAELWRLAYIDKTTKAQPIAVEKWADKYQGKYSMTLYGVGRPNGGYVIQTFDYPNQSTTYDIAYLDDMQINTYSELEARIAIERLHIARSKALHNN